MHFLVPLLVVSLFYRKNFLASYLIMMAGMVIDVDHLLAEPIYEASRCSIGFHPLHTIIPIVLYGVLALLPKTRIFGIGLAIHILLDSLECFRTSGVWYTG